MTIKLLMYVLIGFTVVIIFTVYAYYSNNEYSAIPLTIANLTKKKYPNLMARVFPDPKVDLVPEANVTKVLILAYYRSGSTYFSDLFNFHPRGFYLFEPMIVQHQDQDTQLSYLRASNRTVDELLSDRIWDVKRLADIFKCNLYKIETSFLKHKFIKKSRRLFAYRSCLEKRSLEKCYPMIEKICKESTVRAVKTIRFRIDALDIMQLLQRVPDLKIIHLLRDPRGMVNSQLHLTKDEQNTAKSFGENGIKSMCEGVFNDVTTRLYLEQYAKQTFLQAHYEDLADNPIHFAAKVYQFLNTSLPEFVKSRYQKSSLSNTRANGRWGTIRSNSSETAYAWRTQIDQKNIRLVDKYCNKTYKYTGYRPFQVSNIERDVWN